MPDRFQPSPVVEPINPLQKSGELHRFQLRRGSRWRARELLELGRMKLLRAARFAGRIKVDASANVIFLHAGLHGPCGYEIKNRAVTGFAKGWDKGCGSRPWAGDRLGDR